MKQISKFSVNYPVTVTMIVLGIVLLGIISLSRLGTDLFPDIRNPRIYVELKSGERSPEEMETRFTEQVEALAVRQSGVVNVTSSSRVGVSQVTVEYTWDKDLDEAFLDLQKALTSVSQDPDVDELTISRYDPNESPVILAAFSNPDIDDMNELRKVAENYLENELIRIEGIAEVRISGDEVAEVMVETDPKLLEGYGLTPDQVVNVIKNFNRNVSGGTIEEMGQKYIIKGMSELTNTSQLENLVVKLNNVTTTNTAGETSQTPETVPVLLKDIATVTVRNQEPDNIVHYNGERCLGISIYKETKYNTVAAVEKLNEAFDGIKKRLPGYELNIINNQGTFIKSAISEVEESALIGIIFAVIVLFLFLRRLGITMVVSIAIPISVIATFNLMYFNGLTLNIMTLGGLALGAGMLVDNAIVVVENIFRKREEGLSLKDAAIEGTAEVGGAITASTLTTIVVFLPIVYLQGASGALFKDQAWTVAFSLLSSLVVALLVIPLLAKLLLPKEIKRSELAEKERSRYGHILSKIIDRRWLVLGGSVVLVAVAAFLVPMIGSEFMPETQSREVKVEIELPPGTALERTSRVLDQMEEMTKELFGDRLKWVYTHAGEDTGSESTGTSVQGNNTGFIKIALNDDVNIGYNRLVAMLDEMFKGIPGMEVRFIQDESVLESILGSDEAPLVVEVVGENIDELSEVSAEVATIMRNDEYVYNVKSSFEDGAPEVNLKIDRLKAGMFNLDVNSIIQQVEGYLSGEDAGRMDLKGELTDITLEMPDVQLDELKNLAITGNNKVYLLSELAGIEIGKAPREIIRNNQNRVVEVSAMVTDTKPFDHIVKELKSKFADITLPAETYIKVTGEEQKREEAFGSLKFALLLSIILVYMVMASQFESLIHPFTILLTIPLAGVGAVLAFFILGKSFNIMAFIGIVMLAGIAVNDSIILVDAINRFKRAGHDLKDAIILAGEQRLRPILMTSLTTILALLPLTFGFGDSAALREPMAIAVIGGLVTSTLLTLVVIPCVYYVFDKLIAKITGG
ncbi:MAG: efflux RND transporter permease subunit [Chlorobi bacterium]|nr:efflux RND transporter permease subunit [Chlorobiota bacterium]